jgi:hypothetical protein
MKLAAEPDADERRTLDRPEVSAGNDIPAITAMIITTIISSIRVTPASGGTGFSLCFELNGKTTG